MYKLHLYFIPNAHIAWRQIVKLNGHGAPTPQLVDQDIVVEIDVAFKNEMNIRNRRELLKHVFIYEPVPWKRASVVGLFIIMF